MAEETAVALAAETTEKPPTGAVEVACFHCGLPVPKTTDYTVTIGDERHRLCCRGCEAVAQAIVAAGLEDFYQHRTQPSQRPEELVPVALRELNLYDQPDLQTSFVRSKGENTREASLILEGIVCAACVWLNERHVRALPGVVAFHVNYSTHRAQLTWNTSQIQLSNVLKAIAAIGYKAHPFDPQRQESLHNKEKALALRRLAVAGLCGMQVMMLAVALYAGEYQGMDEQLHQFLRWVSLLMSIPVIVYAAQPFFSAAWRDLRHLGLGMDVPVALAIGGAFAASAWHTVAGEGEVYFDSATMFTFFLLASRFLEMSARHYASRLVEERLTSLPATAIRLRPDGGEETIAAVELRSGDRVRIRPGDTVPADGAVLDGLSSVDESLLSGESQPVTKAEGDPLVGGSINRESPLLMRVDKVGAETVLAAIMRLLDQAQSQRPAIARLADRVASWFVTGLLVIAAAVAWWWWRHDPGAAFSVTLSILVVTCPCALSLATPAALTAALGNLTRRGLLVTCSDALETLAGVTQVVFDKTGTLTQGRPTLVAVETTRSLDRQRCLAIAAALERGSEHPLAQALLDAAGSNSCSARDVRNCPGAGVEGWMDGVCYRLGTGDYVGALRGAVTPSPQPRESTATWVALGDTQGVLAWFALADTLRPDAAATVAALKARGLEVRLLSGDQPASVAAVARQLGIIHAEGGLLPAAKLARINALQQHGAVVAMVGDGINDAPVLAAAQVSIAMGSGTAMAQTAADMVLISAKLETLVAGVATARRTLTIIRQNIGWAIGYNVIALPLAASGWIAPWMAALGMSLSSLLVVGNALRLKWV